MEFDLSTHQLCVKVQQGLGKLLDLENVLKVVHSIGIVLENQLLQHKATKLEGLCTFSFNSANELIFVASPELCKQFALRQRNVAVPGGNMFTKLNMIQLGKAARIDRALADKVYTKLVEVIGRCLREKKSILLSLHHIGELNFIGGEISCSFHPNMATLVPQKMVAGRNGTLRPSSADSTRSRPVSAPRARNPITGEFDPAGDVIARNQAAPPARARNPMLDGDEPVIPRKSVASKPGFASTSAGGIGEVPTRRPSSASSNRSIGSLDTISLMHSPRSQYGGSNYGDHDQDKDIRYFDAPKGRSLSGKPQPRVNQGNSFLRPGQGMGTVQRQTQRPQSAASSRYSVPSGRVHTQPADARLVAAKAMTMQNSQTQRERERESPAISTAAAYVDRLRAKIVERGGATGIKGLGRLLAIMDDNGDKRLSKEEFKYGLQDYGIKVSSLELDQLFTYFDRDKNGFIDVTEFLVGIKGDMNERRTELVRMAFDILDTDKSGCISLDEMTTVYDFSWHPDVKSGKKTIKEAAKEFMSTWDSKDGSADAIIDWNEFVDYYKEVSCSIDDDDYFELMIRNAWRIAGGEGACANTANKRVLVTNKAGKQEVVCVNNELGVKPGDKEALRKRLTQQGVDASSIELHGGVDSTEKAKKSYRGGGVGGMMRSGDGNINQAAAQSSAQIRSQSANRGVQRANNALGGRGGVVEAAAASMQGYSQSQAQSRSFDRDRPASAGSVRSNTAFAASVSGPAAGPTASEILGRLLYTPPCSLEQLGAKLQTSVVSENPRMLQGAFLKRVSVLDPSLSRGQLQQIWDSLNTGNAGFIELTALHAILGGKFGKDKSGAKSGSVIDRVISKIIARAGGGSGGSGIKGLMKVLSIMDDSGDKRLSKEELKYGLRDYGVDLNMREVDDIFTYFDRDRNGFIDLTEFMVGIRGELNPRRKALVRMAFDRIDSDGSGEVTVDEMVAIYDFSSAPEVQAGKKTIKEAAKEFMKQWDRDVQDGIVTYPEFEDYYKDVSCNIDGDDYFELMIRNAWRIAGGEGACANTANKRVLVTNKAGKQEVVCVNNELGVKPGDKEALRKRLTQQGVDASSIELHGGVDSTEKAKKGRAHAGSADIFNRDAPPADPRSKGPSQFQKNLAATTMASVFRAKMARKKVEMEKRKVDAKSRAQAEVDAEANRTKAKTIIRPKGKSYVGF